MEEAINLAAAEKEEMDAAAAQEEEEQLKVCHHGNEVETKELIYFINLFTKIFSSNARRDDGNPEARIILPSIEGATNAVEEKYPSVWYDPSKLKKVVSYYLCNGTQHVLQGEFDRARLFAAMASYLETALASRSGKFNLDVNATTMFEVCNCDERTLVKYLKKRIPCSCLDEIYEEVKSITRTGVCHNCSSTVERSKMLTCSRCGDSNYCCRSCQKADWRRHKRICEQSVNLNAERAF